MTSRPASLDVVTQDSAAPVAPTLRRRLLGQGSMLMAGFAASQGFSFLRNALIGHTLSKGDFGIAATITLMLQVIETLSDLGTDRLIVQATDGDERRFIATAHTTLIARGLITAAVLYLLALPAAHFFGVPDAAWALQLMALVPTIKGFQHLDYRRAQRRLDNRPQLLVETLPQAAALAATLPLLNYPGGYAVALWLALIQAGTSVLASHLVAERPYNLAAHRDLLKRFIAFGWPIWLSAFPLIAVYHGDRIIIGRFLGMEELAAFSAAFMITMVPGLIAAKFGHALMLPALSAVQSDSAAFRRRTLKFANVVMAGAALYVLAFVAAGALILPLAFGPNYTSLGAVVSWLAVMWGLRMLQAVPGMALMALGVTKPFLSAGLVRAAALILSLGAVASGWGLSAIAAAGVAGEIASLFYISWRLDAERSGCFKPLLARALVLLPAAALGMWISRFIGA